MKNLKRKIAGLTALAFILTAIPGLAVEGAREIVIETKKVGEVVHWEPEKIEVEPGEKIKLVAKHDLEGGFDFHGLLIPALKITRQVDRHKPLIIETTVPSSLKPGEYKIGCHFHEKHVPATLVVKAARKK